MLKKLIWLFITLTVLACAAGGSVFYWFIVLHPGPEIKRENIRRILGKESPVFYSDGTTRLGVFFDEAHRQYVSYGDIPVNFINAMVASEDNRFFNHFGFDVIGISRAAIKNIQAKRIVQGGSTLTQQTAKNLFKRTDRSIQAKLKELLFALRLEYYYEKEEIFEFYANQFYVSGNAHGLGVAARYYFDKSPAELSLLECAFIAGSVKKPNAYNPFIKKSQEGIEAAEKRGRVRVAYVLGKMHELNMIDNYQYDTALVREVEFKKGKVGYALDYVMEMIRDAVSSNEVLEELAAHNISNVATSGVRVITTVEKELQDTTLYALRHDLSRLDVRLRGYERESVQAELTALEYKGDRSLKKRAFLFGEIQDISESGEELSIEVSLGSKLGTGIIDRAGITRIVKARVKWQNQAWTDAKPKDHTELLKQLKVGDKVWISIRDIEEKGRVLLDLEKYPELNGGALVMQNGEIKAMAGGVENRFFNRAVYARRTMGSSFKPLVFTAALQLGWNATDRLKNKRALFVFFGQPYFPRPDHNSPFEEVSMSWAGVHSENVASVWLLTHLCDKLSSDQFREVADKLGLAPRNVDGFEEPYGRYRARIRDKYGIVINRDILRKIAFEKATDNVETDFVFEGRAKEFKSVKELHYGLGFEKFKDDIELQLEDGQEELKKHEKKELLLRKSILSLNYLHLLELRQEIERHAAVGEGFFWNPLNPSSQEVVSFGQEEDEDRKHGRLYFDISLGGYSFTNEEAPPEHLIPVTLDQLQELLSRLDSEGVKKFWENVHLHSILSVAGFDILEKQVEREYEKLMQVAPYTFEVLQHVVDFKILVGLHYLIDLSRQMGIKSKMEPVLSFPLGANVVTLLEAVRMYEGLVTGEVITSGDKSEENGDLLTILDRIESADGEVLYRPERKKRKLLAPETMASIGHILENIVKFGTGRYANKHIRLFEDAASRGGDSQAPSFSIPLLGKTGTANRYTNASFFGYLPGLAERGDNMISGKGFSVGVYVGYDDNRTMRKGTTRITGSAGALPSWSEIVKTILVEKDYEKKLDPVDLSFNGLIVKRGILGQKNVEVSPDHGGLITSPARNIDVLDRFHPSIMTFGTFDRTGGFRERRLFQPYWHYFLEPSQ